MNRQPPARTDSLAAQLQRAAGQRLRVARWSRICWHATAVLAVLLACLVADGWWSPPVLMRSLMAMLVFAIAAWAVIAQVRLRTPSSDQQLSQEACRIEQVGGLADNEIVNAVQLAPLVNPQETTSDLGARLAQRAVALGDTQVHQHASALDVNHQPLWRSGGALFLVLVVYLLVAFYWPGLLPAGFSRLLKPAAAVPAYSDTRFELEVQPDPIYVGDDVNITAYARGPNASQLHEAQLVELDPQGNARARWPMRPTRPGKFVRSLQQVREPVTFRVESEQGVSESFRIEPQQRPAVADQLDGLPAQTAASTLKQGTNEAASAEANPLDSTAADRQLREQMRYLEQSAARIASQAQQLRQQLAPGQPTDRGEQHRSAELARRLRDFAAHTAELSQQCQSAASSKTDDPAAAAGGASEAGDTLANFKLPDQPVNAPDHSPTTQQQWLDTLLAAAQHDVQSLQNWQNQQQPRASDPSAAAADPSSATATGRADGPNAPVSPTNPDQASSSAAGDLGGSGVPASPVNAAAADTATPGASTYSGTRHEASSDTVTPAQLPDVIAQQVPPAYRRLAAEYFRRISEDQTTREQP